MSSDTNVPFASDNELFELVGAQNHAAQIRVVLRQPFVFKAFLSGEPIPTESFVCQKWNLDEKKKPLS